MKLGFALTVACLAWLAATQRAQSAASAFEPAKPVAPENVSMMWHDRAYGQLKLAVLKKKGQRGIEHAWLLAELANVNQGYRESAEYKAFAASLSKLSVETVAALKEEKWDVAKALLKKVDAQCTACHEQFRNDDSKGS